MYKISSSIGVLAISCLTLFACGDNNRPTISADRDHVEMPVGVTMSVTVTQDDGTLVFNPDLDWKIDDESVASLTWDGKQLDIAGRAVGATKAHASYYGDEVEITVTVDDADLIGITLSASSLSVPVGITRPLRASGVMTDGSSADVTSSVVWTPETEGLIRIENGMVTGLAEGATLVHADFGGRMATIVVTVTDAILQEISIDPPSATVPIGLSTTFAAVGRLSDNSIFDISSEVTWTVEQPSIAEIVRGRATGKAAGTTRVTASLEGFSGSAELIVSQTSLDELVISPQNPTIPVNRTQQLRALARLSDGSNRDVSDQVTWTSAAPAIAVVSPVGVVRGVAAGTAQITAELGAQRASTQVTISNATLLNLEVTPDPILMAAGSHRRAIATGIFSDGSARDVSAEAVWTSDTPTVATVAAGDITGVRAGAARITASLAGRTSGTTVLVTAALPTSLTVIAPSLTLPVGSSMQLQAIATFGDGTTQDVTDSVVWTSNQILRIAVSNLLSHGVATALSAGPARITATLGLLSGSVDLTATSANLVRIELSPSPVALAIAGERQLAATAVYDDGSTLDVTTQVLWTSSAPAIVTVSNGPDAGLAKGRAAGTATISAQLGLTTASVPVTVTAAAITALDVTPDAVTLARGARTQLTVTATFSDGTHADVSSQVVWSSSAATVATVSNAAGTRGQVTAVAIGSASITATLGALTASTEVTVTDAQLTELQLTPAAVTLPAGTSTTLVATGVYSDGTTADLSAQVSWTSSAPAIATVANGHVTAVAAGTASVTATLGTITASAAITVTSAAVTSLAVTPPTATLALLQSAQLTATATFSDATTGDVTQQAVWTSSNPLVVLVSNAPGLRGRITGLLPGTATITATLNGQTATAAVTVSLAALVSMEISPATLTLPAGVTAKITVTGTYSDGTTRDLTGQATLSTSASTVAGVAADGTVTARGAGSAVITATLGGTTAQVPVTVTAATLSTLKITPDNLTLPLGLSGQLQATGHFSDGTQTDVTASVAWTSSAAAIATVSNAAGLAGQVASHAVGTATITATLGETTATASVTVSEAQIAQLQLTPATLTLPVGVSRDIIATAVFSDGTTHDVTAQVSWSSSASTVASVTGGHVTGVAVGTATITATIGGVSQTLSVTVTSAAITGLTITPASANAALGQTIQLTATGTFSDGSTLDATEQVTWTSSNPLVARVSNAAGSRGRVTGVLPGTATISAAVAGATATATVTITTAVVTGLQINPSTLSLAAGTSAPIAVIAQFSDGTSVNVTLQSTLSSSSTTVASVSALGVVSAHQAGTATVTAAFAGQTATAAVTVTAATLTQLEVSPLVITLPIGVTTQVTATGVYSDGSHVDVTNDVTWTSSVPAVATVSNVNRGRVTGQAIGLTTITATLGGRSATALVTVTPALLSEIQVTPSTLTLPAGTFAQLTATGVYSDGTTNDLTALVSWTSSRSNTASVFLGRVAAVTPGTATITAAFGAISGTASVTVTAAVLTGIAITPAAPVLAVGRSTQLTATGTYSDGTTVDLTSQASWATSNLLVALVGNALGSEGLVTALLPGTAIITATVGGVTASVTVAVTTAVLVSVEISPSTLTLPNGNAGRLTALGRFSDGTVVDVSGQAVWTSSAPATATVSSTGLVTGRAPGTATVTAAINGRSATAAVTITSATLESLQVSPLVLTLPIGVTSQMTATGTYSDGSSRDVTGEVTWTSSLPGFASVSNAADSRGVVTGLAVGVTTITATLQGRSATSVVTVTPAVLLEIQLTPATLTLPAGVAADVTATGVYSDGTTHDLTALAGWSSSAPATASVIAGHLTALAPGSATITATLGGKSRTLALTVSAAQLGELAIDPPQPTLSLGQSVNLTATGTYSDNTTADVTDQVTWQTSNILVAAVSNLPGSRGRVTGLLAGTATITATLDGVSTSITVTVTAAVLLTMQVTPSSVTLPAGLTQQLTVLGTFSDLTTRDLTGQASWSSSAPSTASVVGGLVTAAAPGTAIITATVGLRQAFATVTVTAAVPTSLQITPASLSMPLGVTSQLTATGVYSDGSHADATTTVTWTSSAPAVATVSNAAGSKGRVTSQAQGDAVITATLGAVTTTAAVHVGTANLVSISVVGQDGLLPLGLSTQLTAFGTYTDGSVVDLTAQATFASSGPAVTVSNAAGTRGLVRAVSLGQAVVSATVGDITGELTVGTTAAQLVSIAVSNPPALPLGVNTQLTATGTYSDGSVVDLTSQATWASSAPAVASVSGGLVTANTVGTATILATLGGVTGTVQLTTIAARLTSITVSPATLSLALGLTSPLVATGTYTDGSTLDVTAQATWISDQPLRAAVSNVVTHGVVTALLAGTAHITATIGSVTSNASTVTVTNALLLSITVSSAGTMALGEVKQLTATARYTDGSQIDVTSAAAWVSSQPASAVVSNLAGSRGQVTAVGAGSATISATLQLVTGTTPVDVAQGCHVVINEVKTGTLLALQDEFVELFNPCTFPIDVSRERLVYRSALGLIDLNLVDLTGTMAPGSYRVYGGPAYTGVSNGGLLTDLSALGGGIAIRDIPSNAIVDAMGYGTALNLFVEGLVALVLPTGKSLSRIPNGVDTNNNRNDFASVAVPTPGGPNA